MLLKSRLPKSANVLPTFAGAFFQDLWAPSPSERQAMIRLFDQDRPAFEACSEDAWRRGDHSAAIAALEVLDATDGLTPGAARRLWSEMLLLQRWEDALRLLEDRRFAMKKHADYWCDLATARAAARSLATARAPLDRALNLDPRHARARDLAALLERGQSCENGAQTLACSKSVDPLIDLHRYRQAAARLGALLLGRGGELSTDEQDLAADRARTLFRVLDPARTTVLFLALRSLFRNKGLGDVFQWACEALAADGDAGGGATPDFGEHLALQACFAQALAACGKWKAASAQFGRAAALPHDPLDCRQELARCVGRAVSEEGRPTFAATSERRKIIDIFPFFDELLLLRLKLAEMSPWVDRFVLVEARASFAGAPKAPIYEQNREAFAPYADKIIHRVVDFPDWANSPWAREFYQRDAGLAALSGYCGPDDLVFFSDADEIIAKSSIDHFKGEYASFGLPVYAYFFNLRRTSRGQAPYGGVCRAKHLERIGVSHARMGLHRYSRRERLADAGWHFTSIKDLKGLLAKVSSFSHVEHARAKLGDLAELLNGIRGRGGLEGHERCDIDDGLPRALHDNLDRVSEHIL